ncbi:MAG: hypothetical protein KAW92_04625 [Candidatus Cloacimonetes bacterium]|nr:hypothetical protein [Candidatus Cloacimonadota bacterium]MCK4358019.1 hypothetical protein [Candidatus Cloacimonadota bacterium]
MKIGIFNEFMGNHKLLIKACEDLGVEYKVINIISADWIENVLHSSCDYFLASPSNLLSYWKTMFEEKIYYIENHLRKVVYPSFKELYFYENKKNLAYWLGVENYPHPKTWVFYSKKEAIKFSISYKLPVVFKTNVGSAAMGVKIVKNRFYLKYLIFKAFPLLKIGFGGILRWNTLKHKYNIPISVPILSDVQKGFIILQEFIQVRWEWRIIKIGESYFGHQKLQKGKFHSGSDLVGWVKPSFRLLDMIKSLTEKHGINCMAFDVFEDWNGKFYINEMQTSFLSRDPSQMYIDGIPGRFVFRDSKWKFEKGYFNKNGSNNLRILNLLQIANQ